MITDHNNHVEMLKKAAAAFEKLPDSFELLGVAIIYDGDEAQHVGLHVTAKKPDEFFPELTNIDENALYEYAKMAGIKMWFELRENNSSKWDYLHVLDENGTELYQGCERRAD